MHMFTQLPSHNHQPTIITSLLNHLPIASTQSPSHNSHCPLAPSLPPTYPYILLLPSSAHTFTIVLMQSPSPTHTLHNYHCTLHHEHICKMSLGQQHNSQLYYHSFMTITSPPFNRYCCMISTLPSPLHHYPLTVMAQQSPLNYTHNHRHPLHPHNYLHLHNCAYAITFIPLHQSNVLITITYNHPHAITPM
jgi:hypothetical protein